MRKVNPILGIDIAGDFIKIVELEPTSGGIKVSSFDSATAPPESIKEGLIVNPNAVSETIISLLTKNNILTKRAVFSIRSPYAFLRLSRMPFMSREQLQLALQKEVGQYIVLQGKEPVLDSHIVEEISEEGRRKMNVLFAVATKECCNSYVKVAELAGLNLLSIDISTLAILRCLNQTNLKVSGLEVTMLVAISLKSTDICILKGEKVRYYHTVKVDASQVSKNIDGFVDKLTSALKLVLNFYQAKYAVGERILKIVLSCDSFPSLPLKEGLERKLGNIPMEVGNPLGNMIIDENKIPPDKVRNVSFFTCAIGAALQIEGLSSYSVRFNLIPKERYEKLELSRLIRFLNIILGGALAISLILATFIFINNRSVKNQIYRLQQQLGEPDPLLMKVNSIFDQRYKIQKQIENRTLFLSELFSSTIPWDRALINAMAKVPPDSWLVRISSEGTDVKIQGRAYSEKPIFKFVKLLDNSFYFRTAKLVSSQNVKVEDKEELAFTVVCNLRTE